MQIPYDVLQLSLKGIQETWMMGGDITALLTECHCECFFFTVDYLHLPAVTAVSQLSRARVL